MKKRAIVVFNLGGPDNLQAVKPFLYNLFKDPAIINLPIFIRLPLARLISIRRDKVARIIYEQIGGKSPILEQTLKQVKALEKLLKKHYAEDDVRVFLSMRYWHPMSSTTMKEVIAFDPDEIVLLPLYPQYSTTTTGSSLKDWKTKAKKYSLDKPTFSICCYGTQKKWVDAQAALLTKLLNNITEPLNFRVLFSAHGLPLKIIQGGDPYQLQVEESAQLIAKTAVIPSNDWRVCYQSKVGPLEWIQPSLEDELVRASKDKVGVVVLPIAFVSEHSETLVELDIEFKKLAKELGINGYYRVPALGDNPTFIESLGEIAISAFDQKQEIINMGETSSCRENFEQCPHKIKGSLS